MQNENQILGYENFISRYDEIYSMLRDKNRSALSSKQFAQYVAECYCYLRSLSPYEVQYVSSLIPDFDEKMNVVVDLYTKIKAAVCDAFQEVTKNRQSD